MWKQQAQPAHSFESYDSQQRREAAYLAQAMNARVRRGLRRPRHDGALWFFIIAALVVVAGLLWFKQSNSVQSTTGLFSSTWSNVRSGVSQLDKKIVNWDDNQLRGKLAQSDSAVRENLKTVRAKMQSAWADLQTQLGQNKAVESRVQNLETQRNSDDTRVAALEGEVARLKSANATPAQTPADQAIQRNSIALASSELGMATVPAARIDFEVNRNQAREISTGITVQVTDLDPVNRTLSGTVTLQPEQTVALKHQSAYQPVVIPSAGMHPGGQLIFTQVTQDAAVGYYLPAAR
jgi:hypothetical protein